MKRPLLSLLLALGLALPSAASAATWTIDGAHTIAGFSVRHMMVTNVKGRFHDVKGTIQYDPAKPEATVIEAEIDATTVDTENQKRDDHLRSPDFFDAANHPKLVFRSKRVTRAAKGRFEVVGDLTLRGVTKEVVMTVEGFDTEMKDPRGTVKMGGTATTRINRKDFGLNWNKALEAGGVLVGEEVTITLDVELDRQG